MKHRLHTLTTAILAISLSSGALGRIQDPGFHFKKLVKDLVISEPNIIGVPSVSSDGALTVMPGSLSFGNVGMGDTALARMVLTNTSSNTLSLSTTLNGDSSFTLVESCQDMTPGSTCEVSVQFNPTQAIGQSAGLLISYVNAGASRSMEVPLSGTGTTASAVAGRLQISADSVSLGALKPGIPVSKSVTIYNPSSSTTLTGLRFVSSSGLFSSSSTCASELGPQKSCQLTITGLANAALAGKIYASPLTIYTNEVSKSISVIATNLIPLEVRANVGVIRNFLPSISSVDFGATYVNTGSIKSIYLQAGVSTYVADVLVSSATISGPDAAKFKFVSAKNTYIGTRGFGAQDTGSYSSCGATVTNSTVNNCVGDYSGSPDGYNDEVYTLVYTPTTAKHDDAVLTINHNGSNSSPIVISLSGMGSNVTTPVFSVSSYNFGALDSRLAPAELISEGVYLINGGSTSLPVALTVEGAGFNASHDCPSSLEVGAYCTVQLTLNPLLVSSTNPQGSLFLNKGTASQLMLPVSATVIDSYQSAEALNGLVFTNGTSVETSLNMGSAVQNSVTVPVYVKNTGASSVYFSLVKSGPDFSVASTQSGGCTVSGTTLMPDQSCAVLVTYTPVAGASSTGSLVAQNYAGVKSLSLAGTGGAASLTTTQFDGTAYKWSDGTTATSCYTYLHPTGGKSPQTADGFYYITPSGTSGTVPVYCDMTTDGGGWTLVLGGKYAPSQTSIASTGAVGSNTTGSVPNAQFKLADSFINAIPVSGASNARYRIKAYWNTTISTRFVGAKTYGQLTCGSGAVVTSYSNASLTTGAKGGVGYGSVCGLSDYSYSNANYAYFVTGNGSGAMAMSGAGEANQWGGAVYLAMTMFVR